MPDAVIVDAVRSPIGRAFKGSLTSIRPDDLGAYVVDQLLDRHPEVDPASVKDLICGCGMTQGEQAYNIGRIMVLLSEKLPDSVTDHGISVNTDDLKRFKRKFGSFRSATVFAVSVYVPLWANPSCFCSVSPPSSCHRFDMRLLKLMIAPL